MQVNKLLVAGFFLLMTGSCIDPFQPDIEEKQDLMVIQGNITDKPGEHYVTVSRSSPFNEPDFIPVTGCVVRVEDETGEGRIFLEEDPGIYSADLNEDFLGTDHAYRLFVYTTDGKEYQSEYDSLIACSKLDSLYYEVKTQETEDPGVTYYGLQFYVDVHGDSHESKNYLWKLEETFEYRSSYLIQYIWDGTTLTEYNPPIDSLYTCYKTQPLYELYAASSRYLVSNELKRYPLTYVSNQSPRLKIRYSLRVQQNSLSNNAFRYWEKMKNQLSESGGLYETQPVTPEGNIYNVEDADEKVLGYFYASQIREKRVLVKNTFEFPVAGFSCPLDTINNMSELGGGYPFYMISVALMGIGPPYGVSSPMCFNCKLRGGTNKEPDFWHDND